MTLAAQELHLTQSGVSQHVKSLEDVLGISLFDRIHQRLVPTKSGELLFQHATRGLAEFESALAEIKGADGELRGSIALGVPREFGNNVVLPLLVEFSQKHPRVRFELSLGSASEMGPLLLEGRIDFAFVDDLQLQRGIVADPIYDEVLELCVHQDLIELDKIKLERAFFEAIPYVSYGADFPMLKLWFQHHLGVRAMNPTLKASVFDVHTIALLIQNKVGAGILPSHLVDRLKAEGAPVVCIPGKSTPVKNRISSAIVSERTLSPATQALLDFLKERLGVTVPEAQN